MCAPRHINESSDKCDLPTIILVTVELCGGEGGGVFIDESTMCVVCIMGALCCTSDYY